jgi:hypothetical protein
VLAPVLRPAAFVLPRLTSLLDSVVNQLIEEVVRRVDLDAAVERVDVDAVVRRVDIEAILDRIDLTATVLDRVDLEVLVREILERLDEPELSTMVERVDVDAVVRRVDVESVLDRVDLTAAVLNRVDLKTVVDAALAQVDMIALAEEIIDGVDLPEIIRESTGSMASETVKGVRMQGIGADRAVGRAVDRLLLRHDHASDDIRS